MKTLNTTNAEAIQQLESLAQSNPKSANRREHRMTCDALNRMPPDLHRILMACHLDKRSHEEIGRAFGVSAAVIASLNKEALRRFVSVMAVQTGRIGCEILPRDTGDIIDGDFDVKSSRHYKPHRGKK